MEQVKDLRELDEVRGAIRMLSTIEHLPIHVQDKLAEFEELSRKEKELSNARERRRTTL